MINHKLYYNFPAWDGDHAFVITIDGTMVYRPSFDG